MISLELSRRLRSAGLAWSPEPGDRFIVPDRDMDAEVFVISEMVVEVREVPTGRILAFNGTTEWALDSIEADTVVWLPREDQLRDLLGNTFTNLAAVPGGFVVTITVGETDDRHIDTDVENAYARALLALLS